ncbi:uncharacterized protein MELLADRAFT_93478 [Melampsora larici-populina 98AG31]|uniref:Uncharacterized protein n=1 Tax=Melampsora larici-populina (strain 98AG31 / pathotype 3-4-7) TaxID=747676 RepID=F4RAJ1_MELLP|nr:uncharacterized protein MELLADRAFT_93478 [Melampsora larici-populina 98AG31]EGG10488.1 hypothetical protein MELLADRAFT_93478 [Melampsora larici-populina 98AG31]
MYPVNLTIDEEYKLKSLDLSYLFILICSNIGASIIGCSWARMTFAACVRQMHTYFESRCSAYRQRQQQQQH